MSRSETPDKDFLSKLNPQWIQFEYAFHYHLGFGSTHSKYLVVDQNEVVITGANVQNCSTFDLGFHITGNVGQALRDDFEDLWKHSQVMASNFSQYVTRPLQTKHLVNTPGIPILTIGRQADGNLFRKSEENPQDQAFRSIFRNAKRRIRILTPNLNFEDHTREILNTLKRGVDVQIILSWRFNDSREQKYLFQGGTNEATVSNLLGEYMRTLREGKYPGLGRLEIQWFSNSQGTLGDRSIKTSHAKYLSADEEIAVIGSANQDTQSWYHSRELNLVLGDAEVVRTLDQEIFQPVLESSTSALINRNP